VLINIARGHYQGFKNVNNTVNIELIDWSHHGTSAQKCSPASATTVQRKFAGLYFIIETIPLGVQSHAHEAQNCAWDKVLPYSYSIKYNQIGKQDYSHRFPSTISICTQ